MILAGIFIAKLGRADMSYKVLKMFHSCVSVPERSRLTRIVRVN